MVSTNMKNIIDQYKINTSNMFANSKTPKPIFGQNVQIPAMPNGNWVTSWKPSTASGPARSALTSIQKNQGFDVKSAAQNFLGGLGHVLDIIDRPRNAIDSMIYDATSKNSGGLGGVLNAGWQGLTGQQHHSFNDVLKNLGPNWQNNSLGFIGDVITDPLTYVTFGAGSVAKDALKPFVQKGLEEAVSKGAVKGTQEFANIMAKHVGSTAAEEAVKSAQAVANKALVNVGVPFGRKVAVLNKPAFFTRETQKISVPAAEQLASKMNEAMGAASHAGQKSKATQEAASQLRNDRIDLISHMIGRPIQSTKDLNTQEYDFINQLWNNGLGDAVKGHYDIKKMPDPFGGVVKPKANASVEELSKFVKANYNKVFDTPLPDITGAAKKDLRLVANNLADHINQANQANISDFLASRLPKAKESFNALGKTYKEYDGLTGFSPAMKKLFVKTDEGGALTATNLGKVQERLGKLFGSRRFVPMSTQIMDHRIQSGMGHILGAGNKGYAYSHDMIEKLKTIAKTDEFKSLTPDEWKEVAYTIEGQKPSFAGYTPPTPDRQSVIDKVAKMLVGDVNNPEAPNFLNYLNKVEADAGLQRGNIEKYFPHVYNIPQNGNFQDLYAELMNMGKRGEQIAAGLKHATSGFQKGRQEFATMADLTDALEVAKASGNPKLANFIKNYSNVSWNPLEAFGKRAVSGMQQVAKKEAIDNIIRDGLALDAANVPDGWIRVGSEGIPKNSPLEELKGKIVPKEVHSDLMKINKLLTNDADLNKFMDQADKVLSILRRNYTVTKLGFHVRQTIGNIFQNTLAGVTPPAYSQAMKYIANPEKYPQWTKEVLENGIIHTGTSGADLASNLGEELSTGISAGSIAKSLNPVGSNFFLAKYGRKAGEYEDDVARIAHYMYMRGKGLSQQEAADSVRKYLFNYSEISTSGQFIRRLVPFYQWMRNNLPFQVMNTLKNPKAYNISQSFLRDFQNQPDPQQSMEGAGINNPLDQATVQKLIDENGGVLPKYIQDNYIKTPWGYYSIGLPTQDLKQSTTDPISYFFGSMNPYMNLIGEMNKNQSSLTNAPIDKSVPAGHQIWDTTAGWQHLAETALGSPAQLYNGLWNGATNNDWSNVIKGLGLKTQQMDPTKQINNLLYQKALELNTKAKAAKAANGG